uniref:Phospholipase-like protein n=1 Tax=Tanacetum cinerariifolium TaxID=118510 RepID=A0A699H0S5_TANCI|nr:phospholipase-like protein [Tanacetum cinerariifolium]
MHFCRPKLALLPVGLVVTNLDVLDVIEDEVMFGNLCDEGSVRLCLILALEVIFLGRLLTCHVDDSLSGLVENLEACNVFPWGEHVLALERNDKLGEYLVDEELKLCLEEEERIHSEQEKRIQQEKRLRLEEEKMLRLEEEKMLQIVEVKKRKRYEFMNSTPVKNILGNFPPIKRNDAHFVTCKAKPKESWVKIKKYCQNVNDPSLAELLKKVKPWVETCGSTICGMVDVRMQIGPWLVQLLMQNNMPLFYANGDKYGITWSDVDQVFIPINETDQHWCLAHLDILSGLVTFYDSEDTYDYEWRDWYVGVRKCLELYLLALSANSLLVKDMMVKLFEIDNERDLRIITDTYAMCQQLHVCRHERREQMLEMQSFLHVSTSLAESYKWLEELQDFNLEKCRDLMKSISETQLKVLKKLSFIAKLCCQLNEKPENYVIFEVNYDGVFNLHPLRYDHGKIFTLKLSKLIRMSFSKLLDMLSYKLECEIWGIFYSTPRSIFEEGLTIIGDDFDMNKMYDMGEKYGLINFYIAHSPKELAEYYYKTLSFDAADEDVFCKIKTHEKMMQNAGLMSPEELIAWEKEEAGSPLLRTPPLIKEEMELNSHVKTCLEISCMLTVLLMN